jgi:transcriptional regulator with XRE-family HTH domain
MSTLAQQLRSALQQSGTTARELASRIGLDESTVSLWLSGQRTPRIKNLEKIAATLGIGLADLLASSQFDLSPSQQSVVEDMAAMSDHLQQAVAAIVSSIRAASEVTAGT